MNIPEVLKREKRFVCHDEFKRPINPHTGRFASVTNSNTWGSFQEAILYVNDKKAIGIGFVLGDGFVGIDIDTCIDKESGAISEEALENITILDSYTEISKSGMGTHTIIKATDVNLPFNKKKMKPNGIDRLDVDIKTGEVRVDKDGNPKYKNPELEIYDRNRYFILTGNVYESYFEVNERSNELKEVINKYTYGNSEVVKGLVEEEDSMEISIEEALKLDRIFNSCWKGKRSNKDESADDLALMGKLLYWCNGNINLSIKYFKESPHAKQKDESHKKKLEREDYLLRTARAAMQITTAAIENNKWKEKREKSIRQNSIQTKKIQEILMRMQPHIKYSYDDRGNGDLFSDIYKEAARFNTSVNEWYVYNGKVWERDVGAMKVSRMAKELKDELLIYSISIKN